MEEREYDGTTLIKDTRTDTSYIMNTPGSKTDAPNKPRLILYFDINNTIIIRDPV